jgi:hypothetical protein
VTSQIGSRQCDTRQSTRDTKQRGHWRTKGQRLQRPPLSLSSRPLLSLSLTTHYSLHSLSPLPTPHSPLTTHTPTSHPPLPLTHDGRFHQPTHRSHCSRLNRTRSPHQGLDPLDYCCTSPQGYPRRATTSEVLSRSGPSLLSPLLPYLLLTPYTFP